MLDGTRDAGRDVELRRNDLAGLAHLPVVGRIAGVHRCTRGPQGSTQPVGQRLQHGLELLGAAQSPATGDNHLGSRQLGTVTGGLLAAHQGGLAIDGHGRHFLDGGRAAFSGCLVEGRAAHRQHLDGVAALHGGNGVAGVDGPAEGVGRIDAGHLGDLRHIQQGGHARHEVLAVGGGGGHHVAVVLGQRHHLGSNDLGQRLGQRRIIHHLHLGDARHLGGDLRDGIHAAAQHQQVHLTQPGGRIHGLQRGAFQGLVVVFCNNQYCHGSLPLPLRLIR